MKIIITGTTGMAGEGVLLESLENDLVSEVLSISRKSIPHSHPKLKQLIVPDFIQLQEFTNEVKGYDACFFCAGVSSVGMREDKYTYITYDTTIAFAKVLVGVNSQMTFCYISGAHTDSTEKGRIMWARIKGRTENDLIKLGFRQVFNFRPGGMSEVQGQLFGKKQYRFLVKIMKFFAPKSIISLNNLGKAMIHVSKHGYNSSILEIKDIKQVAL